MSLDRILSFEGQLLATIDRSGPGNVAGVARDMIDAGSNILLRLEGSREAAAFTFALSDRMVSKVLGQPTEAPVYLPPMPAGMPRADSAVARGAIIATRAFGLGVFIGLISGAFWGFIAGRLI